MQLGAGETERSMKFSRFRPNLLMIPFEIFSNNYAFFASLKT